MFGIFDFDFVWTLIPLISFLYSSGGTGPKLLRRAGVPFAITLYALGYGMTAWKALIALVGMLAVIGFGPGYGDDFEKKLKSFYWPYLFLLGGLYGASNFGLALHYGHWFLLGIGSLTTSVVFVGSMYLSKRFQWFQWKWAEMMTGASIGLTASLIVF